MQTLNFNGIVYLSKTDYTDLVTNGSITKSGQTLTYNDATLYVTNENGIEEYYVGSTQWDTAPTNGSIKPVTSGGVYSALSNKQDKIDSSHKLDADLVDDSTSTNKFVTASDKTTWSGKQNALPTTSTAGQVLKSTSTSGTVEWGDVSVSTNLTLYKSIAEVSSSLTNSSTILEVMTAMNNNSILIADASSYSNIVPDANYVNGLLEISKVNVNRASAKYTAKTSSSSSDCLMWYGEFQSAQTGYEWSGWKRVAMNSEIPTNYVNTTSAQNIGGAKVFTQSPLTVNGDMIANYVKIASVGHETTDTFDKYATISTTNYVRYRTKAEMKSDLGISDNAQSIAYTTTAPTAANTTGLKIAVLSSEPSTRYSGWLYIITE